MSLPLLGWMAPALAGMLGAAGVSYVGSRLYLGLAARRAGLLAIPEELALPEIAARAETALAEISAPTLHSALETVISDNRIGALHLALLSQYAPHEVTELMAMAHYRAYHLHSAVELQACIEPRLHAAALADTQTVNQLRRLVGGFA